MTPSKAEALALAERYVCPNRVQFLGAAGIDFVIGKREGYHLYDLDGTARLDLHLNGGVYNLGHRNPDLIAVLTEALGELDIGNHHFPSVERALLAEQLVTLTPGMQFAVFASGGGEAIDVAIKSARRATGRTRIVSAVNAYHGHTGLALSAGDERAAAAFHSAGAPGEFSRVPFNDADAITEALAPGDVAAVILETVPATAGFPRPAPDYLPAVRRLCDEHGAALIADEVQTGLGRTGNLWATQTFGVTPDILVTGKGLSGGLYPIAATLLSDAMAGWLKDDGWSHISTFGGAELGCRVARAVLDLTVAVDVGDLIARWSQGLADLQQRHPGWLVEVRQTGLVIGLKFAHEFGGMLMTRALYDQGVWAMFAGFDRSVLQVKPGLLLTPELTDTALAALDRACAAVSATMLP